MRGRIERRKRESERDLFVAYHSGLFARAAKIKPYGDYLARMRGVSDQSRGAMAVLGALRGLQKKGMAVSIKRLN